MLVTNSTGQVGNTFVEIDVKQQGRKMGEQFVAGAVGMWEAHAVCELSKALREERESVFCFSALSSMPAFP
jgi:hypothetical protein